MEQREEQIALDNIKEIFNDNEAEINDHKYEFTVMTFGERRTVFAYLTAIQHRLQSGDLSFIDEPKYKEIEKNIIFKRVTVEGMSLSKKNVFESDDYMADYIPFVSVALTVISYPFLKGQLGV